MKTLIVFVRVCLKQSHLSRLLRVPWTAKRSNQSILTEINSEYSLEGLMLKLQYFGHLKWRVDSLEKTLMLGKTEGGRRRGQQRSDVGCHHQLNGHEFEQTPGDTERQRSLACCSPWGCRVRHDWATEHHHPHQEYQQHKDSLQTTKPDAMKSIQKGPKLEGAETWWLETKQKTGLLLYWLHDLSYFLHLVFSSTHINCPHEVIRRFNNMVMKQFILMFQLLLRFFLHHSRHAIFLLCHILGIWKIILTC